MSTQENEKTMIDESRFITLTSLEGDRMSVPSALYHEFLHETGFVPGDGQVVDAYREYLDSMTEFEME